MASNKVHIGAISYEDYLPINIRIPVLDVYGQPLMPTKTKRAEKWVKEGKAELVKNGFGLFCIRLKKETITKNLQKVSLGLDPGNHFTGIGIQSKRFTLFAAHLELPQEVIKKPKQGKKKNNVMDGSIKGNRLHEINIIKELISIYPICRIVIEISQTKKERILWNQTLISEKWITDQLKNIVPTITIDGVVTSQIRNKMKLIKQKNAKGDKVPETQAVDGIALASYSFASKGKKNWRVNCRISTAPFVIISKNSGDKKRKEYDYLSNIKNSVEYGIILRKEKIDEEMGIQT